MQPGYKLIKNILTLLLFILGVQAMQDANNTNNKQIKLMTMQNGCDTICNYFP